MIRDAAGFIPNSWPTLSAPIDGATIRVLSLGVGVQSVTLAMMAARRDIGPMPDLAIFADTGGESVRTYEYLDYLAPLLPFPIIRTARPGLTLAEHAIRIAHEPVTRTASPPWHTDEPFGMLPKQCSAEFKRDVVHAEVRRQLGIAKGKRRPNGALVEQWIGISKDEMQRVASARVPWVHNRHPLIEANMTRRDCLRYLEDRQIRLPIKSSCIFCPYRTLAQWREMFENSPEDWEEACRVDEAIRPGFYGMEGRAYVQRQRVPLREIDFNADDDPRQLDLSLDCDACGL